MALQTAYRERRREELHQEGLVLATAFSDAEKLDKLLKRMFPGTKDEKKGGGDFEEGWTWDA